MAEDKKIQLIIDGISQVVDETKSLKSELGELRKSIDTINVSATNLVKIMASLGNINLDNLVAGSESISKSLTKIQLLQGQIKSMDGVLFTDSIKEANALASLVKSADEGIKKLQDNGKKELQVRSEVIKKEKEIAQKKAEASEKQKEADDKATADWIDKWTKISTDMTTYTTDISTSVNSMFGAIGSFIEHEKAELQKKLADITKQIAVAQKDAEAAERRSKQTLESSKKNIAGIATDGGVQKDIAEMEELYRMKESFANTDIRMTDEQESRLQSLSGSYSGYYDVLDHETAVVKGVQKKKNDLEADKKKVEKKIQQKEHQKKKMEMTQNMMQAGFNIAMGITKALALGPIVGPILAGVVSAAGAVQLSFMATQFAKMKNLKMADGGLLQGKRHTQGGMRIEGSNIEVEGGEYVVNRESTSKNLGLMRYINSQRRELTPYDVSAYFNKTAQGYEPPFSRAFEAGGELPIVQNNVSMDNEMLVDAIRSISFAPTVAVTDILRVQDDMDKVASWSGI